MDEIQERRLRRQGIRRLLKEQSPTCIARLLHRSRPWLNKWWHRFLDAGWSGLQSHSRQPHHPHYRYRSHIRRLIVRTRRVLERARVGLIGPEAVRGKLRTWRVRPLPSRATIAAVLHTAGLTHPPAPPPAPSSYYPHPHPTPQYRLQAIDWTSHQLRRGQTVFAFNTVTYGSRDLHSRVYGDKSAATVCAYALTIWQGHLGLPDGLQMDNDGAFSGGRRGPRVFSRFVRLCLFLGIEPIFIPFYEAERNELVEFVNGLWQRAFWRRRRFRSRPHVQRCNPEFERWYRCDYRPPGLDGQTPAETARPQSVVRLTAAQAASLPERLPITAGRVHFLRWVDARGEIVLLNESWRVGVRLAGQYVWAVIDTQREQLLVYHRRSANRPVRLVKTWTYRLREPVVPLRPEFHRRARRRQMLTML
jgi:hypothetical protein